MPRTVARTRARLLPVAESHWPQPSRSVVQLPLLPLFAASSCARVADSARVTFALPTARLGLHRAPFLRLPHTVSQSLGPTSSCWACSLRWAAPSSRACRQVARELLQLWRQPARQFRCSASADAAWAFLNAHSAGAELFRSRAPSHWRFPRVLRQTLLTLFDMTAAAPPKPACEAGFLRGRLHRCWHPPPAALLPRQLQRRIRRARWGREHPQIVRPRRRRSPPRPNATPDRFRHAEAMAVSCGASNFITTCVISRGMRSSLPAETRCPGRCRRLSPSAT